MGPYIHLDEGRGFVETFVGVCFDNYGKRVFVVLKRVVKRLTKRHVIWRVVLHGPWETLIMV